MTTTLKLVSTLVMASAVVLTGCKKKEADAAPDAVLAATPVATAPADHAPPAAPAAPVAQAAAPAATFDINSVPVSTATLPPFPYLDWPVKLEEGSRTSSEQEFDGVSVIAGTDVRQVEGRVSQRFYSLGNAKLSKLAAERNYEAALKSMGAVQVNKIELDDPTLLAAYPKLKEIAVLRKTFHILDPGEYKSYLIRTPQGNIWIATVLTDDNATIVTIEEKAMEQSIKPLGAGSMPGTGNAIEQGRATNRPA